MNKHFSSLLFFLTARSIVLFLAIAGGLSCLFAADRAPRFELLDADHGLSQNSIHCLMQDSKGFLWIGTEDGLNRYDGSEFVIFKHDPLDSLSLSANSIWAIEEGRNGIVWIGTQNGGLDQFDRYKNNFRHFMADGENPSAVGSNNVLSLLLLKDGRLLVGTDNGLDVLKPGSPEFEHNRHDTLRQNSLSHNRVVSLLQDSRGAIWVGTTGGLNIYSIDREEFTLIKNEAEGLASGSNIQCLFEDTGQNLWIGTKSGLLCRKADGDAVTRIDLQLDGASRAGVRSISEPEPGTLWIATESSGVVVIDSYGRKQAAIVHDSRDGTSLSDDRLMSTLVTNDGIVWVGCMARGLNKYLPGRPAIRCVRADPNQPTGLSDNSIWAFGEDSEGHIWVGTFGGGLNCFEPRTGTITAYRHDPTHENSPSSDAIVCITIDAEGTLWLGTYGQGFNSYDPATGIFRRFRVDSTAAAVTSYDYVLAILSAADGSLWLGTGGKGLVRMLPGGDSFQFFRKTHNDEGLSDNFVFALHESTDHRIWVGTTNGLNIVNPQTSEVRRFYQDHGAQATLPSNEIRSLADARQGDVWVGTNAGLCRVTAAGEVRELVVERDGLPSGLIYSVLSDATNNLWLTTTRGISRFNPVTRRIQNYYSNDGLQADEFNQGAALLSSSGFIYAGGNEGFSVFHPDSLISRSLPIVVNSLYLNHSLNRIFYEPGPGRDICVQYNENTVTVDYVSINFWASSRNHYQYKLEGNDQNWVDAGGQTRATYTHVKPGEYLFRVRNESLDPDREATVRVVITPPFWEEPWFIALEVIVAAGIVVLLVYLLVYWQRKKVERNQKLEVLRRDFLRSLITFRHSGAARQDAKQLAFILKNMLAASEVDPKLIRLLDIAIEDFLKNTGHKLDKIRYKARLAGWEVETVDRILGLIDIVRTRVSHYQTNSLLSHWNLLDIRVVENSVSELIMEMDGIVERVTTNFCCDVRAVLIGTVERIREYAQSNLVNIHLDSGEEGPLLARITESDFSDIIEELIHNAVAAMEGIADKQVWLKVVQMESGINIYIRDSGCGIERHKYERIFAREYTTKRGEGGSGLYDAAYILRLYGGNIELADSSPGKGSTFLIRINSTNNR